MSHIDYVGASFNMRLHDFAIEIHRVGVRVFNGIVPRELWSSHRSIKDGQPVHRKPYKSGLHFASGFSVFYGGHDNVLIEVSGTGCANSDILAWMKSVRETAGIFQFNKFTRIDIAHDIETETTPFDAVTAWGIRDTIKTRNVQDSLSGQTFYVGSRKSDRFCRVYRYREPHPRADMLRIEYQFNKTVANDIADQLCAGVMAGDVFQKASEATFKAFNHQTGDGTHVSVATTHERSRGGSVVWFYKQVAPALARLVDAGEITLADVFTAIDEKRNK